MLTETLSTAKTWLDAAVSFFYPEVCQYCSEESANSADGFIGLNCRQNLKAIEAPFCERCGLPFPGAITTSFECSNCRGLDLHFSKARSAVLADGMIRELIHRYKYNRDLWLEPFLADLLNSRAVPELLREHWDLIVPVPLHRLKQTEREFNQAERLARRLSEASGIPLETRILKRIQPTRTQTRLTRPERIDNVRKAFALSSTAGLNSRHIVLIDDVFTTGATTSSCAKVLLDGGAAEVCVWTVARGGLQYSGV
jgi:competence protein ComFC